ncbi:uncharacterized protein LOC114542268 isoform X2 [Dendronephthya gigantea]|uniref:uncharacterized protein LOC114542268 isoform X2 n=1 Tax=Dendronephthya gigantea TaxID=151771 RepID=UPI00106BE557|nr:uncharacterized protein LOC114542268 isoform X2 [Dendronephthya gigantea]
MKSAELALVLSAYRDWYESNVQPAADSNLLPEEVELMENILKENEENSTMSFSDEEYCSNVLSVCQKLSWRALEICAPVIIGKMCGDDEPAIHESYPHNYIGLERLDKRLYSFIPPFNTMLCEDGTELEPFQASSFGNCFWCTLSIHLAGNESKQNFLRLASALNGVVIAQDFIVKIFEQCITFDDALQWSKTVCSTEDTSETTIMEVVHESYVSEVKETFRNFRDSGLLQVYLASNYLRRPIRQFCLLPGADHYRSRVEPLQRQNEEEKKKAIDVLWVPLTVEHGQRNQYNHIGAAPYKLCMFNSNMNLHFSNLKSDLAQCDLCQEWYHACCLGQSIRHINRMERFSCGCDALPGDANQITTKNAEIYNDMDMFERCLSKKELKMIAKNFKRNVIPYLRAGASSHAISSSEDMKIYLKSLDYGPVMSSNMVQSLFDAYLPVVNGIRIEDANTFLQDVLLPEGRKRGEKS